MFRVGQIFHKSKHDGSASFFSDTIFLIFLGSIWGDVPRDVVCLILKDYVTQCVADYGARHY